MRNLTRLAPAILLLTLSSFTLASMREPDPRVLRAAESSEALSPFLLTATYVRGWITGPVAHVEVTQSWENPNGEPVDGLYIFPLPETAAVTDPGPVKKSTGATTTAKKAPAKKTAKKAPAKKTAAK